MPEDLSQLLFRVYIDATSAWAYRQTTFDEHLSSALTGAYIVLLADAAEAFRPKLLDMIGRNQR